MGGLNCAARGSEECMAYGVCSDAGRCVRASASAPLQVFADGMDQALNDAYAEGRRDERERCERLCAAEQAENRELAKGSKSAMYDWMADGAGLCLGAIRSNDDGRPLDPVAALGWLPIETAPIDERILIAATPDWVVEGLVLPDLETAMGEPVTRRTYHHADGDTFHPDLVPTHWMPLPPPPQGA